MNAIKEKLKEELRKLAPRRISSLGQAKLVGERQAALLLRQLRMPKVPVNVFAVVEALDLKVEMRPRYLMADVSGRTACSAKGSRILINQNDTLARRRMTLAHEIKHALDDDLPRDTYDDLGLGDEQVRDELIEKTCDHFAACLLIPKSILRRAWFSGIQDVEALADLFEVSVSAMKIHLRYWGFTTEEPRPPQHYFTGSSLRTAAPAWMAKWCGQMIRRQICPFAAGGSA